MDWLQFQFEISGSELSLIEARLETVGALSVTLHDAADEPFFEPAPGEMPIWNKLSVTALFPGDLDADLISHVFFQDNPTEIIGWRYKKLEDQAWERVWMKDFHPIQFGERLWVVPSWHKPPQPDHVNLILDPGLAFGSGTHATTALCLRWLDKHPPLGQQVLDFGCGSGILAIAAIKLGAAKATGIDIDPQAIEASAANAERNGVDSAHLLLQQGSDAASLESVDLVIANILSGPLIELAPQLTRAVRPGGNIILSGILAEQVDNVVQAYQPGFENIEVRSEGDWQLIEGRRKPA